MTYGRFRRIVIYGTHQAQRMGMGAVMGAKKLKALVLRGGQLPPIADEALHVKGLELSPGYVIRSPS